MKAPIYIKIEQYKEIIEIMGVIKNKIVEVRGALNRIDKIKREQEIEMSMWSSKINEIEEKINAVDQMILEPK